MLLLGHCGVRAAARLGPPLRFVPRVLVSRGSGAKRPASRTRRLASGLTRPLRCSTRGPPWGIPRNRGRRWARRRPGGPDPPSPFRRHFFVCVCSRVRACFESSRMCGHSESSRTLFATLAHSAGGDERWNSRGLSAALMCQTLLEASALKIKFQLFSDA